MEKPLDTKNAAMNKVKAEIKIRETHIDNLQVEIQGCLAANSFMEAANKCMELHDIQHQLYRLYKNDRFNNGNC